MLCIKYIIISFHITPTYFDVSTVILRGGTKRNINKLIQCIYLVLDTVTDDRIMHGISNVKLLV
jgi:hypothetical protein